MQGLRGFNLSLPVLLVALIACGDGLFGPGETRFEPAVRCVNGQADGYACQNLDLLAHVPILELEAGPTPSVTPVSDMWGWTDGETGRDYVLVGRFDGVSIVDVTDPLEPHPIGRLSLPTAQGKRDWRDIKVYADHAFVVAEGSPGHGVRVFDLRRLRGVSEFTVFTEDVSYDGVSSAHNIAIDEATGFAYAVGSHDGGTTCGGGLHMIDVRTPASPTFAGCFAQAGYTHDVQCVVYDGPDSEHRGREVCLAANVTDLVIADVTEKNTPIALSTVTYPDASFIHQGWLTPDHRYFLQNDKLDEHNGVVERTRLLVWDVSDLEDPVLATEYFGPTSAIDHNIFVHGDLAYLSNLTYGLRILDVSDPTQPKELAHFDTHAGSDFPSNDGSWSNYPFFDNGVIVVSSSRDGLFLLQRGP